MLIPRWTVVEDDKALYILRNMIGQHLKECVPMMEYVPKVNSVSLMEYVQKVNFVPMNEYAPKMEPGPVIKYGSKVESVQMMESDPKMETVRKREYLARPRYTKPDEGSQIYTLGVCVTSVVWDTREVGLASGRIR
ncbi:hypothetical protein Tco_0401388 [Tanacetum coccineum]